MTDRLRLVTPITYSVTGTGAYAGSYNATAYSSYLSHWDSAEKSSNPQRFKFWRSNGYLPVSAYSRSNHHLKIVNGSATLVRSAPYPVGTISWSDPFGCGNAIGLGGSWDSSSRNAQLKASAIADANSRVRDQRAGLAETLSEVGKTIDMCTGLVSTVVRAVRQVRRKKFFEAARTLGLSRVPKGVSPKRDWAGNWLEYRYGWLPLYSEVYGLMTLAYDFGKTPKVCHATGHAQDLWKSSSTVDGSGTMTTDGGPGAYKITRTTTYDCSYVINYIYTIENETLLQASRLGLGNPAGIAWELVPFSFVVDWFINVGDVLDTLLLWKGKTFLSGSMSRTMRYTVTEVGKGVKFAFSSPPSAERNGCYFGRSVLSSPPPLGFRVNPNLTTNRFFDALALLKQVSK